MTLDFAEKRDPGVNVHTCGPTCARSAPHAESLLQFGCRGGGRPLEAAPGPAVVHGNKPEKIWKEREEERNAGPRGSLRDEPLSSGTAPITPSLSQL